MRRALRLSVLVPIAALAGVASTGAVAAGRSGPKPNPSVRIGTATIKKLGTVLVNGSGHVLYMFAPDRAAKVTCNAACQRIWPPVTAPLTGVARAVYGARQSLIGSDRNPVNGRRIVTYDGWPLYTYVLDTRRHQAGGQDVALNGGYWWVLTPAGRINRKPVPHGGFIVGS